MTRHEAKVTLIGNNLAIVGENGIVFASASLYEGEAQRSATQLADALFSNALIFLSIQAEDGEEHVIPGIGDKNSLQRLISELRNKIA